MPNAALAAGILLSAAHPVLLPGIERDDTNKRTRPSDTRYYPRSASSFGANRRLAFPVLRRPGSTRDSQARHRYRSFGKRSRKTPASSRCTLCWTTRFDRQPANKEIKAILLMSSERNASWNKNSAAETPWHGFTQRAINLGALSRAVADRVRRARCQPPRKRRLSCSCANP